MLDVRNAEVGGGMIDIQLVRGEMYGKGWRWD